jgi:hypothetical protein
MTDDYEPQTAMLLTQQEWDDLCGMVKHYRTLTEWSETPDVAVRYPMENVTDLWRQRALAERIIKANQ